MTSNLKPLYLFSVPRSGSTLAQRILATHPQIATVTEPFLLLPYLYSLKDRGVYSEYNHQHTAWGIQDFCSELPNGKEDYLAEIRNMVLRLYAKASREEPTYFLDKTPNYFLIAEDIIRLFPEGKFIFLWRNPLSVASSLMQTWHGGKWHLYQYDINLFEGISSLISTYQKYAHRVCSIRYEDMLADPVAEWQRVFGYLELPFDPELVPRFSQVQLKGRLRDHQGMRDYQDLNKEPLEKWKSVLVNPLRKSWCRRYLNWIGRERLTVMGYDLDKLLADLDALPLTLRFLGSDIWWMPYGSVYRVMEGRMLKHKLQALRSGQRVYIHK